MRAEVTLLFPMMLLVAGGSACCSDSAPGASGISNTGVTVTDTHQARTAAMDQAFIEKAMGIGILDIKASDLELRQDNMPNAVTQTARALISNHARADFRLEAIARAKGFRVPNDLPQNAQDKLLELQALDGKQIEFLQAYDSFLLQSHEEAISLFEDEAKHTADADLKAYAQDVLSMLQGLVGMVSGLPYAKEARIWWKIW